MLYLVEVETVFIFQNWPVAKSESAQYLQKDAPGVPPNISCFSVNITEQVGPEQQPLTAHHLSCFRCHMLNISKLTPELSSNLITISQYSRDMERLMNRRIVHLRCHLPTFEHDVDKYEYLRSLLQLLDQRLNKTTFWFHCKVPMSYLFILFQSIGRKM